MAEVGATSKTQSSSGKGRKERRGVRGRSRVGSDGGDGDDDDDDDRAIVEDARFAAASTRPQFSSSARGSRGVGGVKNDVDDDGKKAKKREASSTHSTSSSFDLGLGESLTRAIESDERFRSALASEPEKFGCVPARDKFGRKTDSARAKKAKEKERRKEKRIDGEDEVGGKGDDGDDDDDGNVQDVSMEARIAYLNALSRGDISASSSSPSDDDDSDDDDDDDSSSSSAASSIDEVYGKSGFFDPNRAPLPGDAIVDNNDDDDDDRSLTDEPSRYLCVLNLNWDRVRAVDVFAMLHSFCPPGTLRNVTVYPSDFGTERMERERVEGPPVGIWKGKRKGKGRRDEEDRGEDEDDKMADDTSGDESSYDEDDTGDREHPGDDIDSDDDDDDSDDDEDEEEGEDAFNLAEATSNLYAHFPPQSTITKNSRLRNEHDDEEGFDVEKLREYEASKLRYYYAVATFASSDAASRAYEGIDGMEMEDTAAEIDVRVLPEKAYPETVSRRSPRDSCDSLPARYEPPEDAAATALRQSRVTCTWERGDAERERKLTRYYGMGKDAWEAMANGNDIGFYLATSDNSSGDDGSSSNEDDHGEAEEGGTREKDRIKGEGGENVKGEKNRGITASMNEKKKKKKGSSMRAMLGLEGSDSEEEDDGGKDVLEKSEDQISSDSSDSNSGDDETGKKRDKNYADENNEEGLKSPSTKSESESSSDDEDDTNENKAKDKSKRQVTFMPGKQDLEGKIRSKILSKYASDRDGVAVVRDDDNGLSPYEKYLEKRKEKRRERRQADRNARKKEDQGKEDVRGDNSRHDYNDNDGMYGVDPEFGVAPFSDEESVDGGFDGNRNGSNGFFVDETSNRGKNTNAKTKKLTKFDKIASVEGGDGGSEGEKIASTKEELELLIAGDDDEEHAKDYDMRGLTKLERQSSKKLKGKRKRQHETLAANVSGQGFHIDTSDSRFAALLDGSDDRFGIDRTNPAYKETGAMKELLHEQTMRRNKNIGGREMKWGMRNGLGDDKSKDIRGRNDEWIESSSGALELSSLVKSIKQKVSRKT